MLVSGKALGGKSGDITLSVGNGNSGDGGRVKVTAGDTTAESGPFQPEI